MNKNFLIVKNYLRKYNKIQSAVQYQYGDMTIFDVDSDDYDSILSIDIIIKSLLDNKKISEIDKAIIDLFKDGYTYEEIGEVVGLSRQTVSKKLNIAIKKISEKFFKEE